MDQIEHLHITVSVKVVFQQITPRRPDGTDVRVVIHIVVDLPEVSPAEVGEHHFHAPLSLAQKYAVSMGRYLLAVEHHGNASKYDRDASASELGRDLESTRQLARKHHRKGNKIGSCGEINLFDVLVYELNLHVTRKRSGKDHWAVRGQMKLGLPLQFLPCGIYEEYLHTTFPKDGPRAT